MNSNAGIGDEVFGSGEGHEAKNVMSATPVADKTQHNLPKTIKFLALGAISFAIPVLYYLQANELKKKELQVAASARIKDSIYRQLQVFYDTSIQFAKIKAYQAYSSQLMELIKPLSPANIEAGIQDVQSKIESMSNEISDLSGQVRSLRTTDRGTTQGAKDLLTRQDFYISLKAIGDSIGIINQMMKKFPATSSATPLFKDTGYFVAGQLQQYGNRLSDLKILYDTLRTKQMNRRRRNIENQLILDKTQRTIDSLINGLNLIYSRLPKL